MTEQPPVGYGPVDVKQKYSLHDFKLVVNGVQLTAIKIDGETFIIQLLDDNIDSIELEPNRDPDRINKFKPTDKFWRALVYADTIATQLARDRNGTYGTLKPKLTDYPSPVLPHLPKYEEVICINIYHELLYMKGNESYYFRKRRKLAELLKRAYVETEGYIPPRLKNLDQTPEDYEWL